MITQRRYKILVDFTRVHEFLTDTYDPATLNSWLLPQYWEHAQMHPAFAYTKSHHIGLWEDDGEIVGVACYELDIGDDCQLHTHRDYKFLLPEMLSWAERELSSVKDGKRSLAVKITDREPEKRDLLKSAGYVMTYNGPCKIFPYDKPFPDRKLPEGFTLIDGTDIDDVSKIHACWWKGFDHGDTPDDNSDEQAFSGNAPHMDLSLMTIAVAPSGEYVCAAGMWFDEQNKYAYLEPLATIPEYRRMGLATVCLTEAMKKTKALGATYCFVGDREFYSAIGCETIMNDETWKREW